MLKIITFIKLYRTTLKISLKQNPQNSSPHILDNPITVQTSENAWKTNLIQRIHKNKKKKKKKKKKRLCQRYLIDQFRGLIVEILEILSCTVELYWQLF